MTDIHPDFICHFGEFSTVWTIEAVSNTAKAFANECFTDVEDWMGTRENFTTDWRPARNMARRLAEEEGFTVCCKQPGRDGLGMWRSK